MKRYVKNWHGEVEKDRSFIWTCVKAHRYGAFKEAFNPYGGLKIMNDFDKIAYK